ncbi:phosphoribosylglycinamide formyltransferase [Cucumibacter marinus]|uniref:phosphoribosylglycinamide formyltransferase n=1 Tax=Cucumibacter marinus TaxID=1121252 RepID=UPI0004120023|nr:phosphoribosylglycinamide formyltransferase [Cucumibacter marinus]
MSAKKRVAILISGRGSNMEALIGAASQPGFPAEIVGVFSNKPDAKGLETAAAAGIATASRSHRDFDSREAFDAAIEEQLAAWNAGLVCHAGFMRILSEGFTSRWAGKMLNIHPSLLPSFRGLHTHRAALDAGVKLHGCTVHFVTPELDGGPAIIQAAVPVMAGDNEDTLSARVLEQEHRIYPKALEWVASGAVRYEDGKVTGPQRANPSPALVSPAL